MFKTFFRNKLLPKIYKLYLSSNLTPKEFKLEKDAKCLLLAPHADDESIGAGGLLALHGGQFKVVCLTNGYKGAKNLPKDEAVEVRKEEFKNAMEMAKVSSYEFLGIDDKSIISSYEAFSKLETENYDYIFIPNIIDQHVDHKSVSINLARLLKEKNHKSELKIVFYEVWSALPMPNAYLDISSVIETKRNLINCHKSQTDKKDYAKRITGLNCYRGLTAEEAEFAEGYLIMNKDMFLKICKACL